MNTPRQTHIHILLDRSGSMESIATDVIGSFNTFLREQQANGGDARLTLVQFNHHDPQHVIMAGAPILEATPLDATVFKPLGGTPLLDATGMLVERAQREVELRAQNGLAPEQIVFVSITDGEENASRTYKLDRIRELIRTCEEQGWTFVFLSAGLDAYDEAGRMGVRQANTQAFEHSGGGVAYAMSSLSVKMCEHRESSREGRLVKLRDFFGADKPAEQALSKGATTTKPGAPDGK